MARLLEFQTLIWKFVGLNRGLAVHILCTKVYLLPSGSSRTAGIILAKKHCLDKMFPLYNLSTEVSIKYKEGRKKKKNKFSELCLKAAL